MTCKKGGFMKGKGEVLLICDGTGFGYGLNCFVGWYRGKVKLKEHCKVLMVLGEREGKRMIRAWLANYFNNDRRFFERSLSELTTPKKIQC